MMLQDFINQNNGKGLDFDGYYGDQCVDLAQFYNRDVLGNAVRFTGNAVDVYGQQPEKFTWTLNTPYGVPQNGDIVIWSGDLNGGPGHIAVFIQGDTNQFDSFDQNWPTGSPCHGQHHNYNYVMGWGHPTQGEDMAQIEELKATLAKANATITDYETELGKRQDKIIELTTQVDLLTKQVADLQKQPVDSKPPNLSNLTVGQLWSALVSKIFNIK